jgi:Tfp pilus assembly protein PilN
MRPVNLIPPEDRRGDRAPTRTGPLAYVLVGGLALVLAAVTAVVLTGNQISDREAEVVSLEAQEASARERAEALAPYAEFAALEEARVQTVDTLARSRFDWERVLRELALVIPADIQLTSVTGTVSPEVQLSGGGGNDLRDSAAGPALELAGCAPDHEAVAALAASLEDIDGVTRVGVNGSATTDEDESGGGSDTASLGSGSDISCASSGSVTQFEMIAAFDEVDVAAAAAPAPETSPVPASAEGEPAEVSVEGEPAEVTDARAQEDKARESTAEQTGEAGEAAEKLIPGTIR